jgi:hypothetical protein
MRHQAVASLDVLLAPETLSSLTGQAITSVRRLPFTGGDSGSGSGFLAIETNEGHGPRFVVKLSSPARDWIVRATGDTHGREVLVWETGLLDRLPPEVAHPVVGCARDDTGWAILMRDVSDLLIPGGDWDGPIRPADHALYLDGQAALHATFWCDPDLVDPSAGLCSPRSHYTTFSPVIGLREGDHSQELVRKIREGWAVLLTRVEPELADLLVALAKDPAPLCAALARYPQTLVHGDPRPANLGLLRRPPRRVILLDWHFAGPSAPAVDLAWYLSTVSHRLPVSRETTIAWYRHRLARRLGRRFDDGWWQPQLELSLLGQSVRGGWMYWLEPPADASPTVHAWRRDEFAWWSRRAMAATRWL